MEIVQVVALYPPHLGGQEAVVEQLATRQAQRHRVTVYTSDVGAAGQPRTQDRSGRAGSLRVVRLPAAWLANTPVMPGLVVRLLTHTPRPDVIHVHTGQAFVPEIVALAATLRRTRYVAHQHLVLRPSGRLGRLLLPAYFRLVLGPVLRRADRVICLTAAMRDEVVHTFGVTPARVAVIANGVDTTGVPAAHRRRTDELLFVGRLAVQKNIGALLHAAAALRAEGRDVRVRIIGDGPERRRLQDLTDRLALGGTVAFEGRRDRAAIRTAYARATALVLPSTHEGMPLVLLEAMAAGIPVVAAALPEIVEVGGDAVLTVDVTAPGALAAALGRVLDDVPLRTRLAAAATVRAQAHAWPAVTASVEGLYAEVLGR
ncbi:glycosyltransferase family 4 protein [Actinoplanes sp. NPDC004185]